MSLSEAAILVLITRNRTSLIDVRKKAENSRNAPDTKFDLYVISFICINFEAFTTLAQFLHVFYGHGRNILCILLISIFNARFKYQVENEANQVNLSTVI